MHDRKHWILRIVQEQPVGNQRKLQRELGKHGIRVTQSTLSRDLKELGLVKVAGDGGYRYVLPDEVRGADVLAGKRILKEFVTEIDHAGHLLVVKTEPGNAQPVARALDRMQWPEVVGTVAGDDTLIVVLRHPSQVQPVTEKILQMVGRKKIA
ncbi:MAG: arginine repressor [Acidobacteria bacterium]|nr:arginine repressor [Acidobacteriota bacterium]